MTARVSAFVIVLCCSICSALATQDTWGRYFIGSSNASVELPKQPIAASVPLAESVRSQIAHLDASRVDAGDIVVLLTYSEYKQKATNLDGSVSGAIAQIKASGTKTGIKSSSGKLRVSGKDARMLKLSFQSAGKLVSYSQLFIGDGKKLWQVVVGYPASSKSGAGTAQRILSSVQFK